MRKLVGSAVSLASFAAVALGLAACGEAPDAPRGTCSVLRSWTVDAPERANAAFGARTWRASGGFVVETIGLNSPKNVGFVWHTEAGESAQIEVPVALGDVDLQHILPVGHDLGTFGALVIRSEDIPNGGLTENLIAEVWRGEPPAAGESHTLGPAYLRSTLQMDAAPSLDGERALIAAGHVGAEVPHGFLMDADGARIGDPIEFAWLEGTSHDFDCLTVVPTAHAAAISVVFDTGAAQVWRFKEVSADGTVVQQITWPIPFHARCPRVQPTADGFAATFANPDGLGITLELVDGAVTELLPALSFEHNRTPAWAAQPSAGGVLLLSLAPAMNMRLVHVAEDGAWRRIDETFGAASSVVSSEPGTMFLARPGSAPGAREISEVGCTDDLAF